MQYITLRQQILAELESLILAYENDGWTKDRDIFRDGNGWFCQTINKEE